jgi:hypothetical protein
VERSQRNVGVFNLHRIAEALDMSLSEQFTEVEGYGSFGPRSSSATISASVVPSALASRSA